MVVTEGAIKLHDGGSGGFVAVDGGRWVIGTLFWNTQADWLGGLAILMAVPYLATIYVSLREPLAEPPPDSYTSKWLPHRRRLALRGEVVALQPGVTGWKSRASTRSRPRAKRSLRR
jgi:hypothetical protein